MDFNLATEVAQGFIEFVFAGNAFGNIKLAAYFRVGFKQGDLVAALGGGDGAAVAP